MLGKGKNSSSRLRFSFKKMTGVNLDQIISVTALLDPKFNYWLDLWVTKKTEVTYLLRVFFQVVYGNIEAMFFLKWFNVT